MAGPAGASEEPAARVAPVRRLADAGRACSRRASTAFTVDALDVGGAGADGGGARRHA